MNSRTVSLWICIAAIVASAHCGCISGLGSSVTLHGLSFCSMMNGRIVDSMIPVGQGSFATFVDEVLSTLFQGITAEIQTIANSHGFPLCQSCLDNLQTLLCAGAFPSTGFYNCLMDSLLAQFASTCPQICTCTGDCCVVGCTFPTNPNFDPTRALDCVNSLTNVDWVHQTLGQCSHYMVSQQACMSWINTCTCNQMSLAQQQAACSLYSPTGFAVSMPGSANGCVGTAWCGAVNSASKDDDNIEQFAGKLAAVLSRVGDFFTGGAEHTQAFDNCANPNLCFSAPTPVAATMFSASSNPLSPSINHNPSVNILATGATETSSAGAIAGGVIGGIAGLAVIIAIVVLVLRRNGKPSVDRQQPQAHPFLAMKE